MKNLGLSRYALCSCVAAASLAACGGSQPPIGAPGAMPQSPAIGAHAGRGESWMLPEATSQDLLYISANDVGNVYAYTYPQGQLVGTLSGFVSPFGECTDAAGDVFIVAYSNSSMNASTIYEYAHGGTTPIAMLQDPSVAFGCAVDPSTGNLAASGGGIAAFYACQGDAKNVFQLGSVRLL